MKNIFSIFIILFLIQSCKDKECEPTSVNPSIHLVTTVGSFWLYDWYSIDSLGNEKILRTDSTYIAGDTVINGKTYIVKKVDGFNNNRVNYLRDSVGFVVNTKGEILWNKNSTGVFRTSNESQINLEWSMTSLTSTIIVPAGTFNTIERTTKACNNNGQPLTPCDTCQEEQTYFSERIGVVFEQTAYIGNFDCSYLEGRLRKYFIQ